MTMFLKILKTAGKAVLWAIAAVLILFLVIIFCPVFYEIKGEKYDKTMAAAKVKALFGILRIDLGYKDGGVSTSVRIFGKRLKAFENETEEKEDENSAAKDEKAEKKPVDEDKIPGAVKEASRVGLRQYARGRAYDPYRYSEEGPTRYLEEEPIFPPRGGSLALKHEAHEAEETLREIHTDEAIAGAILAGQAAPAEETPAA